MGTSIGLAKVTTSLYALQLGADGGWLGALAAAQSGGILLTALPVGLWAERLGPLRLFMGGSLAGCLIYLLIPTVPHPAFLFALTLMTGVIMPARFVSVQMVFMSMMHSIGSQRAGWQRAAHMSGMFLIGPVATAWVILPLGHTGAFWLVASLFAITALLAPVVLRPHASDQVKGPFPPLLNVLLDFVRRPETRRIATLEASIQSLNMFHTFFIVVIAVQGMGATPATAGLLVSLQGGCFIAALLLLGDWVSRHAGRVVPCGITLVLSALAIMSQTHSLTGLAAGSMAQGIGLGLLEILVLRQLAQLGHRIGMGRVAGLNALVGPGGALLGGLLGGLCGQWLGLQNSFLLFVPLFLTLGAVFWLQPTAEHESVRGSDPS